MCQLSLSIISYSKLSKKNQWLYRLLVYVLRRSIGLFLDKTPLIDNKSVRTPDQKRSTCWKRKIINTHLKHILSKYGHIFPYIHMVVFYSGQELNYLVIVISKKKKKKVVPGRQKDMNRKKNNWISFHYLYWHVTTENGSIFLCIYRKLCIFISFVIYMALM